MLKSLFSLLLSLVLTNAIADTLTVKLDGTGDYTDIQNAIGWSSSGDVILIYPGTYYENIDCYGRDDLTIASLFLLNPVDSIIHNTIINGNQTGSCISAFRGEENLRIIGLTMLNGSGTRHVSNHYGDGGGILLVGVSASMECCIIKDNFAINGGGIYQNISTLYLYKTKIYNNHAYENGGGIFYVGNEIIFDSINRCDL